MAAPGRGRHVSTHTMSREKGQTAAGVGVTVLSAFVDHPFKGRASSGHVGEHDLVGASADAAWAHTPRALAQFRFVVPGGWERSGLR